MAQGLLYSPRMSRKILLVEDHADCRNILSLQARALGYEIIEAENGTDGVEKAIRELPDLIVMDLRMPGVDGIEATRRLKSNSQTSRIPIIVYTAWAGEFWQKEAIAAGAAMVLSKPESFSALGDLLAQFQ